MSEVDLDYEDSMLGLYGDNEGCGKCGGSGFICQNKIGRIKCYECSGRGHVNEQVR